MRPKLTYANVMVTILAFIVLGAGGAYAASQLGKNTVGPKQLKKDSVTTAKVKKEAITAAKVKKGTLTGKQINASTLGTVPSANIANTANALAPPEAAHQVGAPNEPQFQGGSVNVGSAGSFRLQSAGFYKDHDGIVHLQGFVKVGAASGPIFTLPPGYRPSSGTLLLFEPLDQDPVQIAGSNTTIGGLDFGGAVLGAPGKAESLDGITFHAES